MPVVLVRLAGFPERSLFLDRTDDGVHSVTSPKLTVRSSTGTPARWPRTMRVVIRSLPSAANSGQ